MTTLQEKPSSLSTTTHPMAFHGAEMLPLLREMDFETRRLLLRDLNEKVGELPVCPLSCEEERERVSFPLWQDGLVLSLEEAWSLLVFCVWVQLGEDRIVCRDLLVLYPIDEALERCDCLQEA